MREKKIIGHRVRSREREKKDRENKIGRIIPLM